MRRRIDRLTANAHGPEVLEALEAILEGKTLLPGRPADHALRIWNSPEVSRFSDRAMRHVFARLIATGRTVSDLFAEHARKERP